MIESIQNNQRGVRHSFVGLYALAYFGLWIALLTPPVMTLALRVAELDAANKEAALARIMGIGAIIAMIANPVAGLLSDRTTSRFGMRRPWLVGGTILGTFGLYLVATGDLSTVLVGWCIAQLGFNAVLAAILALLPDQVPERQRGGVSGVLGICLQVGIVAGIFVAQWVSSSTLMMLMVPAGIGAALIFLLAAALRDRHQKPESLDPMDWLAVLKSFWIDPRKAPDFAWAFLSRFLLFLGLSTLLTYQVFYLIEQLGFSTSEVPAAMLTSTLVITVGTVLGSLAGGWLSDRLERRKVFVLLAALIYAGGLGIIGMASDFMAFLIGIAICGLGQGVYFAVDLALVSEVLPNGDKNSAKDMGIFNLASALPQSLAPAVAPLFLALGSDGAGNYTALFAAAAVFSGLGALSIIPITRVK